MEMRGHLHFDCTTEPPTITGFLEFGSEDYSPEKRNQSMIILTLKERQFIDEAVLRFGDDRERMVWRDWKLAHPAIRHDPAGRDDDGSGRMSSGIAEMVT